MASSSTETGTVTPEKIMQVGLGFWASKALLSAVEMELFTELARGPEAFEPLSGRLGLHPRSARDFLDTLVALGFLERDGDRIRHMTKIWNDGISLKQLGWM